MVKNLEKKAPKKVYWYFTHCSGKKSSKEYCVEIMKTIDSVERNLQVASHTLTLVKLAPSNEEEAIFVTPDTIPQVVVAKTCRFLT